MSKYAGPYGTFTLPDGTHQVRTPWHRYSYTGTLTDKTLLSDLEFPDAPPTTLGSLLGWLANDDSFFDALPEPGKTPPPMPTIR